MNSNDRFVLMRMCRCLDRMGGMTPSNPADIAAVVKNLSKVTKAARNLYCATLEMRDRNYSDANSDVSEAMDNLGMDKDTVPK